MGGKGQSRQKKIEKWAREHPGETRSSWAKKKKEAKRLKKLQKGKKNAN